MSENEDDEIMQELEDILDNNDNKDDHDDVNCKSNLSDNHHFDLSELEENYKFLNKNIIPGNNKAIKKYRELIDILFTKCKELMNEKSNLVNETETEKLLRFIGLSITHKSRFMENGRMTNKEFN